MLFVNIGDGYSSGCCTGSQYFLACDDPHVYGGPVVEHPNSRAGSFVNQLAELYGAKALTFARHRTTIEEVLDSLDDTIKIIEDSGEQKIVFFGIPNLYSKIVNDEYLLLDGMDNSNIDEDEYIKLCNTREEQNLTKKISLLRHYLKEISTRVSKVILYRTTSDSIKLNRLPKNVINTDLNIVDKLRETHKPYKRGYFDTRAYSSLKKEFLKLL